MYEACKIDPESSSCHEAEVGDSAEVVGGAGVSYVAGKGTTEALKKIKVNTEHNNSSDTSDDMVNPEDDEFAAEYGTTEEAVAVDSSTTAYELLGCNLAFDWDTLGAGAIGCWIVVGGLSGTAGYYGGKGAEILSTAIYKKYFSTVKELHQQQD